jgi:predicted O-linked N-acetylglucosamine transferase (SPINDLY family)
LHAACLPDLVTRSHAEYTALALRLAADPALLQDVRRRVADSRTAPFFDTARYARHLEAAYLRMWQNHTAGRMPEPFAAAL